MLPTVLILSALVIAGVESKCQCYRDQNYVGLNAPISNGYDDNSFEACYPGQCGYQAFTNNNNVGWQYVNITWGDSSKDPNAVIEIWDGTSANGIPSLTIKAGSSLYLYPLLTTTANIYIRYTQTISTGSNTFYGSVKGGSPLAIPTTPQTTTPVPTTRTYNSPDFKKDPQLIAHDILIVFNQKSTISKIAGLNAIKELAGLFISQLSISNDVNSSEDSQSRLAVASFTPYQPFYSVQGQIWGMTGEEANKAFPSGGITIDGNFNSALSQLVDVAFDVNSDNAPTRSNVQRTVLVFAADWTTDPNGNLDDTLRDKFRTRDVNLAVIGYNLNNDTLPFLKTGNQWFNYANLATSNISAVAQFVNPFFFNQPSTTGGPANFWCPKWKPAVGTTPTTSGTAFYEPVEYNGPKNTESKWGKTDPNKGQKGRYCNFQNNEYSYINTGGSWLTVVVFYELEVEKDYLKFYADGKEIESFTGYDVNSATFVTNATLLTAKFTTDNKAVYRGFYVSITPSPV